MLDFFTERKMSSTNEMAKLRHWGLIEKHYGKSEDGNSNGLYRITEKGRAFVRGEISVPRYCYIFNDEVNGFSEEKTTIQAALGDKFNYSELIQPITKRQPRILDNGQAEMEFAA